MSDKILILSCGGTFDKAKFTRDGKFVCGEPAAIKMLDCAGAEPENFEVVSLMRKDSLDMDDDDRESVLAAVNAAAESRVVIVHGTDTLVETAAKLDGQAGSKTVVLVGAMRPAIFVGSDASFNLGFALAAASACPAGVWVAMHGHIWPAGSVKKDAQRQRFVDA